MPLSLGSSNSTPTLPTPQVTMVEHDQAKPLAPVAVHPSSDDGEASLHIKKLRRKRWIKCCGIISAILLILGITIVILIFTVFRVKDPIIKLNGVTFSNLELINGTNIPKSGTNMSLVADVSVKNPNVASFKYTNTTTSLYYHGALVGEARGPPGRAEAQRTTRMNISVDIITDQLLASPNIISEVGSGVLNITSYSKVPGRVKILNIVKRHVVVKMNCSMSVSIGRKELQSQKCKKKVVL